jgi:tRNA 5-methylaminomethyl-2-thiouridine biosynthesis bifunctional protein
LATAPTLPKVTFPPPPDVQPRLAARERLARSGLPQAWAGRAGWTILDNRFGAGEGLIEAWQAWEADPQRPQMLHYVGHISLHEYAAHFGHAPSSGQLADHESDDQADPSHVALYQAAAQRSEGIHRILLEGGQVSLTLCIGESSAFLANHRLYANTLWLCHAASALDKHIAKALARVCARGATLLLQDEQVPAGSESFVSLFDSLHETGFVDLRRDATSNTLCATFNPAWSLGAKEPPGPLSAPKFLSASEPMKRCCVVGAGISGASVAYAMARRGWQVTVLEAATNAAAGASGLPAGLVVPHISADDSPRSRLSRVGARLMLQHAEHLLRPNEDWALSGVYEHRFGNGSDRRHAHAGWIRPSALVNAWLSHPHITLHTNASVENFHAFGEGWQLTGREGKTLAEADVVVFANAYSACAILCSDSAASHRAETLTGTLNDLQAVHGTANLGHLPPQWNAHAESNAMPHNGHGCFIPLPPDAQVGHRISSEPPPQGWWLAGSSFEPDGVRNAVSMQDHRLAPLEQQFSGNLQRLQTLLPEVAHTLSEQFHSASAQYWSGTRCVTHDRLPLAGPVDAQGRNGLWMHVGMGARGLTFSALGAELIAARICQEPWPVESSLARSMDSQRIRKRRMGV